MNDFTKKELEMIVANLCSNSKTRKILNKLDNMIENYCKHEWENYCCGCDPENIICEKCHHDIWGAKQAGFK